MSHELKNCLLPCLFLTLALGFISCYHSKAPLFCALFTTVPCQKNIDKYDSPDEMKFISTGCRSSKELHIINDNI